MLRAMPDASLDAVVTDPPYAIRVPRHDGAPRQFDDADPGLCGHRSSPDDSSGEGCGSCAAERAERLLLDASMLGMQSQNWHERATHSRGYADNDPAAFQRWCSLWVAEVFRVLRPGGHLIAFGGTRSWHRLACAVEDAGFEVQDCLGWLYSSGFPKSLNVGAQVGAVTAEEPAGGGPSRFGSAGPAADWSGWGTALKSAFEPIVLARKPLIGTVAQNVARHGVGGLNIDGCCLPLPEGHGAGTGKWPANVFISDEQASVLAGDSPGLTSRFFWVAKPSPRERVKVAGVTHPTVKPLDLMRQLVRLVVPPGGSVLDPFAGSGTTLEAALLERVNVVAVEREVTYLRLIGARAVRALGPLASADSPPATASGGGPEQAQPRLF